MLHFTYPTEVLILLSLFKYKSSPHLFVKFYAVGFSFHSLVVLRFNKKCSG